MAQTEQQLLERANEYIARGRNISRGGLLQLNKIQNELRRRFGYSKAEAPKYTRDVNEKELRPYIDEGLSVGRQEGDKDPRLALAQTYRPTEQLEQAEIERLRQQDQLYLRGEREGITQTTRGNIEAGKATAKDVLGTYTEIPLTEENKEIIRQRAYAAEEARTSAAFQSEFAAKEIARQKAALEASLKLQGIKPIATSTGGKVVYSSGGQTFSGEERQIGSNIKQTQFVPFAKSAISAKPRQDVPGIVGAKIYAQNVKSKLVTAQDSTTVGGKEYSYTRYIPTSSKYRFDVQLAASTANMFSKYSAGQEKFVQQNPYTGTAIKGALVLSDKQFKAYKSATKDIPVVGLVVEGATDTVQPFAESAIKDPVMTYATVAGPRVLGKTAYKALDYVDVGSSVVTGAVEGYTKGGVLGAIAQGTGSFIGEKASDRIATFAQGRPQAPSYNVNLQGKYSDLVLQPKAMNPFVIQEANNKIIVDIRDFDTIQTTYPDTNLNMNYEILYKYQPRKKRHSEVLSTPISGSFTKSIKLVTPMEKIAELVDKGKIEFMADSTLREKNWYGSYTTGTIDEKPIIKIDPELGTKETSITAAHELVHHYTPKSILHLGENLPYRLQPAELLAFGLQKPLSITGFPAKVTKQRVQTFKYNYLMTTERAEKQKEGLFFSTTRDFVPTLKITKITDLTPRPKRKVKDMFSGPLRKKGSYKSFEQVTVPAYSAPNYLKNIVQTQQNFSQQTEQFESDLKRPTLKIRKTLNISRYATGTSNYKFQSPTPLSSTTQMSLTQLSSIAKIPSQTITTPISRTTPRTETFARTPTAVFTKTRTPITTITPTITPTLTPVKLPRFNKKSILAPTKKRKGKSKPAYSPTAYAAGFGIKGVKLTGTLTGLEFRGLLK